MTQSKRLLRLAFTFLSLMLLVLLSTGITDAALHAQAGPVLEAARRQAPSSRASEFNYQAFLESLPRPVALVSYEVNRIDPQRPFGPWERVATVTGLAWDQPVMRFLDQVGVLNSTVISFTVASEGEARYQFEYTQAIVGPLPLVLIIGLWFAFWVTLALWLYQDAKGRLGSKALPWLGLGLIGGPVAIAIWLIQRPAPPAPPPVCPTCRTVQVEDATYCVACGAHLKPTCGECGRAIELSWKHCPTCGNHLDQETA